MSEWSSFDKASNRTLILSAYRSGRLTGAQAWDLFNKNDLWQDREEEFYHYVNGLETFETQKELWKASGSFKKASSKLIGFARRIDLISAASDAWLRDLFGLSKDGVKCGG